MSTQRRATVLIALVIAAFTGFGVPHETRAAERLLVFAASSTAEAMTALARNFEAETGDPVVLSFAGSGALARQLAEGAPADVYVSADSAWMDYAVGEGLVRPDTVTPVMGNRLVLVAPAGEADPLDLDQPGALAARLGDGRLAMGDPAAVPAGAYGRAALTALGHWDAVADRTALVENVRVALALVARGEAPLGLVYATDALAEPGVRVVATLPEESHAPIVYLAAITVTAHDGAEAFLGYLTSPAAAEIVAALGFRPAPSDR